MRHPTPPTQPHSLPPRTTPHHTTTPTPHHATQLQPPHPTTPTHTPARTLTNMHTQERLRWGRREFRHLQMVMSHVRDCMACYVVMCAAVLMDIVATIAVSANWYEQSDWCSGCKKPYAQLQLSTYCGRWRDDASPIWLYQCACVMAVMFQRGSSQHKGAPQLSVSAKREEEGILGAWVPLS